MADGTNSPLDDALESVQREDLGGSSAPPDTSSGDPFTPPETPSATEPKKRGRPANPNSRAAQRARAREQRAGNGTAQSAPVNDPPVPELKKEYPKIPAEAVAESIRRIDERISAAFGTAPLTEEEVQGGGSAFAPVLDHYMPMLTEQGGIWVAPLTFILLAYGPRAWEKLEQRQRDKEAQRRGLPVRSQPGEATETDFPKSDARPFSVVGK